MTVTTRIDTRPTADLPPVSRGLIGNMIAVCTAPTGFFRQLPQDRGWLIVALLILVLVGAAAARPLTPAVPVLPALDGGFVPSDGLSIPIDPLQAVLPSDVGAGFAPVTADTSAPAQTLTTALVASSRVLLIWGVQALLLTLIPMLRGRAPQAGRCLHIVIWASVPLALTSALQLAYTAVGGHSGSTGVALALRYWEAYPTFAPVVQALLHSAALQFTLFGLWQVLLLAIGARAGLHGHWWMVGFVVVVWVASAVIAPVATGSVTPAENVFALAAAPDPIDGNGLSGELPLEGLLP